MSGVRPRIGFSRFLHSSTSGPYQGPRAAGTRARGSGQGFTEQGRQTRESGEVLQADTCFYSHGTADTGRVGFHASEFFLLRRHQLGVPRFASVWL